jgi:hypothetical protein
VNIIKNNNKNKIKNKLAEKRREKKNRERVALNKFLKLTITFKLISS